MSSLWCGVRIASIGNLVEVWLETEKMTYNRLAVANGRIVAEKQMISVPTEKGESENPMFETVMYITYALAAAYFTIGIIAFWRYDKVTRKADKMLDDIKRKEEEQC